MAAGKHTVLSAGLVINAVLSADEDIRSLISDGEPADEVNSGLPDESADEIDAHRLRLYPVISQVEDRFPCIVYARESAESEPVKTGSPARNVQMSVQVYSRDYAESVVLAELVLDALDGRQYDDGVIRRYSCRLADSLEAAFDTGIYMQELIFDIRI